MDVPFHSITAFNEAPAQQVITLCADCFGSQELAELTEQARPFANVEALCQTAGELLDNMSDESVLASINAHPPIGGNTKPGSRSASEQQTALQSAGGADNGTNLMDQIIALGREYQDKFGFVFLIRAAGRSSQEILDQLQHRISQDREIEWGNAISNLKEINTLRLNSLFPAGT